jgi:hypothetical protein
LIQRHYLIDCGPHLAFLDQIHQRAQILVIETIRPLDIDLKAPNIAKVFLRIVTSRSAANQQLATALDATQGRQPGIPASEVDDNIDASRETGSKEDLAIQLTEGWILGCSPTVTNQ